MSRELFVVSAPSGAGKTSLVHALAERDRAVRISVSHTTRPPRDGEVSGRDYHFVDEADFEQLAAERRFLEHARVFGHLYGTSADAVKQLHEEGFDVLLEIDWQGAAQIRANWPSATLIFVLPPSIAALEQRLHKRRLDNDNVIRRRLAEAREEIEHHEQFDYLIVNDDFDAALHDLQCIVASSRLRVQRQRDRHSSLIDELLQHK